LGCRILKVASESIESNPLDASYPFNESIETTMKFQFTSAFTLLLLNASASSFGANSPKKVHRGIAFVSGGAVSNSFGTKLNSSVDSESTCVKSVVASNNLDLLSERGRNAILSLIEHDVDGAQEHVYGNWPEAGVEDDGKKQLAEQVCYKKCHSIIWNTD